MRIAFDAKRIFNNKTGLGNYSRTLVDNLARFYPQSEYHLFTPSSKESGAFSDYAQRFPTLVANTRFKHIWRSYAIRKDLEKTNIDIYHGLSNEIPFWLKNTKTVVTIHDVIFKVLPHTYSQLDRWLYEEKTRYACKYADVIIAISEHTKKDLIRFYGLEAERIKVVYQACDPIYYDKNQVKDKLHLRPNLNHLPSEYILYVGSIIERKNLLNLVKAVQQLPKNVQIPIVVVGQGKAYKRKVQQYLYAQKIQHLVIWMENSTNKKDLKRLYENAQLLVYPSLYEGFGLPVVEAMLCGTPVITSNLSSLPEAGGGVAQLVNPLDVSALQFAIQTILEDTQRRKELGAKGRVVALDKFNPKRLTKQVMDLYKCS